MKIEDRLYNRVIEDKGLDKQVEKIAEKVKEDIFELTNSTSQEQLEKAYNSKAFMYDNSVFNFEIDYGGDAYFIAFRILDDGVGVGSILVINIYYDDGYTFNIYSYLLNNYVPQYTSVSDIGKVLSVIRIGDTDNVMVNWIQPTTYTKLYKHVITVGDTLPGEEIVIISTRATEYTLTDLITPVVAGDSCISIYDRTNTGLPAISVNFRQADDILIVGFSDDSETYETTYFSDQVSPL